MPPPIKTMAAVHITQSRLRLPISPHVSTFTRSNQRPSFSGEKQRGARLRAHTCALIGTGESSYDRVYQFDNAFLSQVVASKVLLQVVASRVRYADADHVDESRDRRHDHNLRRDAARLVALRTLQRKTIDTGKRSESRMDGILLADGHAIPAEVHQYQCQRAFAIAARASANPRLAAVDVPSSVNATEKSSAACTGFADCKWKMPRLI